MAKREPLFEADLGDNGGLVRLFDAEDVSAFVEREQSFWQSIYGGDTGQPFNIVIDRTAHVTNGLRAAMESGDRAGGSGILATHYGDPSTRIPLSTSIAAQGIEQVRASWGTEAAKGALALYLTPGYLNGTLRNYSLLQVKGMIDQGLFLAGVTPSAVATVRRTINGLDGRANRVLAGIADRAAEQLEAGRIDVQTELERQDARNTELERQRLGALHAFQQRADDVASRLEATHAAYLEQMKLKAPVQYWSEKAGGHRRAARDLKFFVWGFFALMIGGYVIAFAGLHQQVADFLLQFKESTGALLVISAAFALLASLPLWVGRLLVKFYLSEHHLATDAKERETMTQTYLALTAEGTVDEKDRALILAALFRSTPDGVVKDNTHPDTSPAALLSKLLDGR